MQVHVEIVIPYFQLLIELANILLTVVTAYARWGCRQAVQEVPVRLQKCLIIIVGSSRTWFSMEPHNVPFHNRRNNFLFFCWSVANGVLPVSIVLCSKKFWIFDAQVLPFVINSIYFFFYGAHHAIYVNYDHGFRNQPLKELKKEKVKGFSFFFGSSVIFPWTALSQNF